MKLMKKIWSLRPLKLAADPIFFLLLAVIVGIGDWLGFISEISNSSVFVILLISVAYHGFQAEALDRVKSRLAEVEIEMKLQRVAFNDTTKSILVLVQAINQVDSSPQE